MVDTAKRAPASTPAVAQDQATVISAAPPVPSPQHADGSPPRLDKVGPGARLGPFEILECVGGGGMGRVFRALDTGLARIVALKVLSPEQAASIDTLLRFRNEARSAARLNHNNIVQVYHVGEDQGLPYIAFEFIEGIHVRALVQKQGPLSLAEAISHTFQVAEALAHAASRNVVHRDIKPSNILITLEGRAKLIDMGLARLQRLEDGAEDLTASGVTLGTFDYISPEQARDPRTADVRSDIYSLGCTFFFMLAGRPPFPEGTVLQKLLQHQGDEAPDVRQFRPELPEEVSRVVRKMMAKDPRHRYQDAAKLMEALAALAEQTGLRQIGPGQNIWVTPKEPAVSLVERHFPWVVPVAALIAVVLLLHFLWTASARQDNPWPSAWMGTADEPLRTEDSAEPGSVPAVEGASPNAAPKSPAAAEKTLSPTPQGPPAKAPVPPRTPEAGPPPAKPPEAPKPSAAEKPSAANKASPPNEPAPSRASGAGTSLDATPGKPPPAESSPSAAPVGAAGAQDQAKPGGAAAAPAGAPAPSPSALPAADPAAKRAGVLVVDGSGQGDNRFATLGAACSVAGNSSVIELCYNGRLEERPIGLANLAVTVRAGEGFQPVVVFRPSEIDPVKYPRAMFTLTGTRLTLINLAVELDIPRGISADSWTLFDVGQAEAIRLQKCSLTVRNASDQQTAYHPDVAFFRAKETPAAAAAAGDKPGAAPRRAGIWLTDCFARGEAALLRTEGSPPLELTWDNGLLATTERLLVADVADNAPPPGPAIQITLKHLTAVVRGGLCRFHHSQLTPQTLTARINCTDSIVLGTAAGPLLEQLGNASAAQFRERIVWNGDRNFYPGLVNFWSLRFSSPDTPPGSMTFEAWQSHWSSSENNVSQLVAWKQLPLADRPISAHAPADYALSDTATDNPARKAASDGRDAGMDADRLRPLPPEPVPPAKPAVQPPANGKG